ncbi:hypothetical protein [Anabaena sp. CS-542/02]|uniref:hypothetical protein n=1 Tax=Anabaena sp. CS-542/02 TaxID=3021719 RepID=UPI002330DDB3|nr:hypothetical protein [Anabaena sp. CS-542/02]MDB9445470.1 hypothetical protein [Anabaena sp. CS-542/02]
MGWASYHRGAIAVSTSLNHPHQSVPISVVKGNIKDNRRSHQRSRREHQGQSPFPERSRREHQGAIAVSTSLNHPHQGRSPFPSA